MPGILLLRTAIGALIVVLHLPVIYFAHSLRAQLEPGQGVTDIAPPSLLAFVLLAVLPYVTLALFRVKWNPERTRLGEYDC